MVDNRERLPRGRRALTMNNEHERAVPSPLATRPTAVPLNVVASIRVSLHPATPFYMVENDTRFFMDSMDSGAKKNLVKKHY